MRTSVRHATRYGDEDLRVTALVGPLKWYRRRTVQRWSRSAVEVRVERGLQLWSWRVGVSRTRVEWTSYVGAVAATESEWRIW